MKTELERLIQTLNPPTSTIEIWKRLSSNNVETLFLEKWLSNANQLEEMILLTDVLAGLTTAGVSQLTFSNTIDNSPYSLNEWAKATLVFYRQTRMDPQTSSVKHVMGYLRCCADSRSQNPILEAFESIVTEMLEQYGYDGPG